MKFNLIIDKTKEEELTLTVHERSAFSDMIESLVIQNSGFDRIPAYSEDEMVLLSYSDIECILAEGGKTFAAVSNGKKYRIKMRLYEVEELLPSFFIRINKSAIANEKRIERFSTGFSGAVDAVFKSGYKEYVSRRCFAEIKRRYSEK